MISRRTILLCTALFSLVPSLGAAPPANPAKAGMDPDRLARIPARMKAFVDKGTIPGAVTLVARHGSVASLEAVGYMDWESKKPMRTDTIFQIMSMTKPVTAVGIMILMEEGRLALSDPVEKHLPEFKGMWVVEERDGEKSRTLVRPRRPITLRDLLTHTSGMYGQVPEPLRDLYRNFDRPLSEVVAMGSQAPLDFQPGTKWQYSNIGIATLGRIIEVLSDEPYEKFLETRIFQPLGMKDSFLFIPSGRYERVASLYTLEKDKLKKSDFDIYRKRARYSMPEGGMYATAADLAAFYQMMLNGGTYQGKRILSRATVDLMTQVHTGDLAAGGPGMGYGLAWAVVREPLGALALQSVGSYGHGGAFGTYGWVDPKRDLVGVFLVQQPASAEVRNAFVAMVNSAIVE
jgi:CubicO group peptidase (beta-lactamase class C family)